MTLNLPAGYPARYFAVLDDAAESATFWRLDRRGRLMAWPPGTRNGPSLWKEPGPGREHVIPAGLDGEARSQWMSNWVATVSGPWHDRIRAVIDADPDAAAARFAGFTSACYRCGRHLEDPATRAAGVGPECAPKIDPRVRAAITFEVGRALAARERGDLGGAQMSRERILRDAHEMVP